MEWFVCCHKHGRPVNQCAAGRVPQRRRNHRLVGDGGGALDAIILAVFEVVSVEGEFGLAFDAFMTLQKIPASERKSVSV